MKERTPAPNSGVEQVTEAAVRFDVLIVEDSPSDAAMVRVSLGDGPLGPVDSRLAVSLAEAVRAIEVRIPDCVLLDLGLPDSDGLATLEAVLSAAPRTAVIVLTGLDDEVAGRAAVRAGAQDYLVKGRADAELLGRAMSYAVERRDAKRAAIDSEQRHAMALQASEDRLRSLIENSSDILSVVDERGVLKFASPVVERILGYAPDDLTGTSVLDLVHPDDAAATAAILEETLSRATIRPSAAVRVRTAAGDWRWMEIVLNNLIADPSVQGIVANVRDLTEQQRTNRELALLNRVLRTVSEADDVVVRATNETELLEEMCRVIVESGGYVLAWVAQPDPDEGGRLTPCAVYGADERYPEAVLAAERGGAVQEGLAELAVRTGLTQVVQDVDSLPDDRPVRAMAVEHGWRAQLALPLVMAGEVIGALSVHANEPDAFDRQEIRLLETLAVDLAYGVASVRSRTAAERYLAQMRRNLDALVGTIAATTEARDPYTAGHQHRVALLAGAIAHELHLDADTVTGIEVAGSIHDIGKIAIPAEILSKPGRISPVELELIKGHVQAGYDIIQGIDFPWPIARMVLEHHERLDGSGYPRGLRANDLLLSSRIIAVADVVEAMAAHRPYRPALGIEAALVQITIDRGKRLDADAVDACVRLFREQGFVLTESDDNVGSS
jgi:PAS domain S-box-containing protein